VAVGWLQLNGAFNINKIISHLIIYVGTITPVQSSVVTNMSGTSVM